VGAVADPELIDVVERLAVSLVAITNAAITAGGAGLEPTFRQWRLLVVLGEAADGLRLADVTQAIGGSAPSASRLVRRMEARGLVAVQPDGADRRAIRVHLTEDGARVRSAILGARRELLGSGIARLTPSAADVRSLRTVAAALDDWR